MRERLNLAAGNRFGVRAFYVNQTQIQPLAAIIEWDPSTGGEENLLTGVWFEEPWWEEL